jgi:thiamine-monophosphate kinase
VKSLAAVGEFELIAAIRRIAESHRHHGVVLGIGDDAACVRVRGDAVLTVDSMVEGVHYQRDWLTPRELGSRLLRITVSDLAATGATPRFALLALGMPPSLLMRDATAFVRGLVAETERVGAALVGGNVTAAPVFTASLTLVGEAGPRLLRRDAARVGDVVYLSGPVGAAAAGVAALLAGDRGGPLHAAYRRPPLRVESGKALARAADVGAVIDVSDGLVQDLSHVCRASKVSAALDVASIPLAPALRRAVGGRGRNRALHDPLRYALAGGDDYELLFTLRPKAAAAGKVDAALTRTGCRPRPIGRIVRRLSDPVVDEHDGTPLAGGFDHFGGPS